MKLQCVYISIRVLLLLTSRFLISNSSSYYCSKMASGVVVNPNVHDTFQKLSEGKKEYRYIIFKIEVSGVFNVFEICYYLTSRNIAGFRRRKLLLKQQSHRMISVSMEIITKILLRLPLRSSSPISR